MATSKRNNAWHSAAARARRAASIAKIYRYKKAHGITGRLTKEQKAEARGLTARNSVAGAMPIDAIKGAKPPKPGAHGEYLLHLTRTRVALAHDVVKLVERSTRGHDRTLYDLAQTTVAVINRLLNGH